MNRQLETIKTVLIMPEVPENVLLKGYTKYIKNKNCITFSALNAIERVMKNVGDKQPQRLVW